MMCDLGDLDAKSGGNDWTVNKVHRPLYKEMKLLW